MLKPPGACAAALAAAGLITLLGAGHAAAEGSHTVVRGDTLWVIAQVYSVSVDAIAEVNGIADPDLILPGDVLEIPGPDEEEPRKPGAHVVEEGDTLWALAERYGVTVWTIQEANGLAGSDIIFAGQTLAIPSKNSADPLDLLPSQPPSDPELEGLLEGFAAEEGLDPGLLKSVAYVESAWDPGALSPAGALGVMQLMPETSKWLEAQAFGYELNEEASVYDNAKAGARLLRLLIDWNGGDLDMALSAYYQGQGATSAGIMYGDTRGYVRFVQGVWDRYWR